MTTEIDLTLSGDAFKAQFGTPERIAMLVQKLEDIASHPRGTSIIPKVEALNVTHSPAEMAEAINQLGGHSAYVVIQLMHHIILTERSASEGFYLVQQSRLTDAAEVMGYMSMALEFARDNLKNGRVKDGIKAALSRYRQWCDKMLSKPEAE